MPGNSLALPCTVESVVTEPVARLSACRARAIDSKDRVANAVTQCGNKLSWVEKQSEARRRHHRQPIACVRVFAANRSNPGCLSHISLQLRVLEKKGFV